MADRVDRLLAFDAECSRQGALRLAGVDEAGRGCWAGPVVAAAVLLPAGWAPAGLDDSKRLSPERRDQLFTEIRTGAVAWGACAVDAATVDRLNVLAATLAAMARAVVKLAVRPDLVLVDGLQVPDVACEARPLIKGDGTSAAVAAASVVAKVLRDRIMVAWDRRFPGYGFAAHKGYGAAVHREALHRLGPCTLHRRSYRPVAELAQGRLWNDPC
ncbi:MAG: ribonuclease HII [Candidatus Krumholzibacteriia bacterium]